jgi:fumarylpyruvate hydrolase
MLCVAGGTGLAPVLPVVRGAIAHGMHNPIHLYVGVRSPRDLQLAARDKGRPWDLGKDVEESSVISEIVPMPGTVLDQGTLELSVNGKVQQKSDLSKLIWNIPELIADLSKFYHLQPGDLIFTGTPEGVGPLQPGDRIEGRVDGVGTIALTVGPAE